MEEGEEGKGGSSEVHQVGTGGQEEVGEAGTGHVGLCRAD